MERNQITKTCRLNCKANLWNEGIDLKRIINWLCPNRRKRDVWYRLMIVVQHLRMEFRSRAFLLSCSECFPENRRNNKNKSDVLNRLLSVITCWRWAITLNLCYIKSRSRAHCSVQSLKLMEQRTFYLHNSCTRFLLKSSINCSKAF